MEVQDEESYLVDYRRQQWLRLRNDTAAIKKRDLVIGTVRNREKVSDLIKDYPETFKCETLDVTDVTAIHKLVDNFFEQFGRIDVVVSNPPTSPWGNKSEVNVK